ncbi:hypothetical protein M2347_002321 [Chryseobacterium sp. H1D6B]|uniref:hypothetical protein n=1 Tax=Chryseobacterium sp. H1D6B TaxID=2940588 RepID=UPI0015CAB9FD|nr:hypothetical protein [Chryseobacterium sp. H1D6B]MDH6252594.1 hypothetical protein [Chryseobacterium sp. H1D6B]
MPELERWNGIDQLAEKYLSMSSYAYVANNPVSLVDPDGRWMDEAGNIDTSGSTPRFTSGKAMLSQFLGQRPGEGGGEGTSFTSTNFGLLLDFFKEGNSVGDLFSMIDALKKIGFKDPANDKAKFSDWKKLVEGIPALNELFKITGAQFIEDSSRDVPGYTEFKKIFTNMNKIGSVLSFGYVAGHEMTHSFTQQFFHDKFYEVIYEPNQSYGRFMRDQTFGFFQEFIGLSWEIQAGQTAFEGRTGMKAAELYYGPRGAGYTQDAINIIKRFEYPLYNAWRNEYEKYKPKN